jgi:hypothetical protein
LLPGVAVEGGANGGHGSGGGLFVASGTAFVVSAAVSHNQALGGDGGHGSGGGVSVGDGTVIVVASAITDNQARGGAGEKEDGLGVGGGVYNLGTVFLDAATVLAGNHAATSDDDCFGC